MLKRGGGPKSVGTPHSPLKLTPLFLWRGALASPLMASKAAGFWGP